QIGAVIERERGDAGRYRARHRPELRQAEIDQEDLHQKGRTPEERGVEGRNAVQDRSARQAPQRRGEAEAARGGDRKEADEKRQGRALDEALTREPQPGEIGELLDDDRELEIEAEKEQHEQGEKSYPDRDHLDLEAPAGARGKQRSGRALRGRGIARRRIAQAAT